MNVYNNKENVSNYFLSITKKINEIDGKTRNYGTDTPLYNSEVHIIKAVVENEGIHITALANLLGVTKGSISEVIKKLEKKGMIKKVTDRENLSKICLNVTNKGKVAYEVHEALHAKFDQEVEDIICGYSQKDRETFIELLAKLNHALSEFQE